MDNLLTHIQSALHLGLQHGSWLRRTSTLAVPNHATPPCKTSADFLLKCPKPITALFCSLCNSLEHFLGDYAAPYRVEFCNILESYPKAYYLQSMRPALCH